MVLGQKVRLISASRSGQIVDHVKSGSQVKKWFLSQTLSQIKKWVTGQNVSQVKVGLGKNMGLGSKSGSRVRIGTQVKW